MSKFKLKVTDKDNPIVPLALGVGMKRSTAISKAFYEKCEEKSSTMTDMLVGMVAECETLEEVVSIAFLMGGYQEQEMARAEVIANALDHVMGSLANSENTAQA